MAQVAKKFGVPLVVIGKDLEELAGLTEKIKSLGVADLVLDTGEKPLWAKLYDLTQIRRLAIIRFVSNQFILINIPRIVL